MYTLLFDKEFKKDISKLDNLTRDRILRKVFELEKIPELEGQTEKISDIFFRLFKI